MFCKWCGGNLASSDTKCKRCGREVSALSDCGGFYDLVPNAKNNVEVRQVPLAMPEIQETKKQSPSGIIALIVSCLVIVFLLAGIVFIGIKLFKENRKVAELTEIQESVLAEQDEVTDIVIKLENSGQYVIYDANYALFKDSDNIKWQFHLGKNFLWLDLPENEITADPENACFIISETWLKETVFAENADELELRCVMERSNDGDSLKIVVGGIKFHFESKTEEQTEG